MNRLNKAQLAEKQSHIDALTSAKSKVEGELIAFNRAMNAAFECLEAAADVYNEEVKSAERWRERIASAQESFYNNKSEDWRDGNNGQAYSLWRDEWESPLDEVECEWPEEYALPEIEAPEALNGLQDEPY